MKAAWLSLFSLQSPSRKAHKKSPCLIGRGFFVNRYFDLLVLELFIPAPALLAKFGRGHIYHALEKTMKSRGTVKTGFVDNL